MAGRWDQFGVGIAGAGVIGQVHAAALERVPGARLLAVTDTVPEAARALADRHGADIAGSVDELVARHDIEVVILATPSGLHADQAVMALGAGAHVVTEKPMAIDLAGLDRMVGAAHDARLHLAVMFQTRFQPDALRLKRAVAAGLFGRPVAGNAIVHWHRTQAYYDASGGWRGTQAMDGGGALMNQGIHTIDLLQWILGPVERVSAETATLAHRMETEDTATAALRFRNGALGTIQGTTAAATDRPVRVEIVGTTGRAVLEGGVLVVWEPERNVPAAELLDDTDRAMSDGWAPDEPMGAGHARQLGRIFAALAELGGIPPVPGHEARAAVEIILAIYESARTGQRVTLPSADGEESGPPS
ncbi:MAG: Gfo/Idh/MocA family oxidoreductase [Chloroflexia bacterium]|nr:Gfo/Idh/MocA family oxidoreductase [Chloroflexia bacterium]MDQ3513955.1 Gfo/Idh/MocA family oxidoreductase [Chloroflexota bacterium]